MKFSDLSNFQLYLLYQATCDMDDALNTGDPQQGDDITELIDNFTFLLLHRGYKKWQDLRAELGDPLKSAYEDD